MCGHVILDVEVSWATAVMLLVGMWSGPSGGVSGGDRGNVRPQSCCVAAGSQNEVVVEEAERTFWESLEFRICREFAGFKDGDLRANWCDGLVPDEYDLRSGQPAIRGMAYCGHSGQERWRFTLLLGDDVGSRPDIDWTSLLPADDVTGWLTPRLRDRVLILDPLAACPDRPT
jgi:hypothetical protein